MADTQRTLSALQTLFADNVNGDISAQDLRDFLVTVHPGAWTKNATAKTASFTLAAFDDVHVDLATGTPTNVVATLPASPSYLDKVRVTISTDDITPSGGGTPNKLTWSLNSSNLMASTDDDPYWLFKEGECLELTYYGGDVGWVVTHDGRIPMVCEIADDSGQTINSTQSKLTFNTVQLDQFEMARLTNNEIEVLRPNDYRHSSFLTAAMTDADRLVIWPHVDTGSGDTGIFAFFQLHASFSQNATPAFTWRHALGSGDQISIQARTESDTTTATTSIVANAPRLLIEELL
jgi:hypothetical protein